MGKKNSQRKRAAMLDSDDDICSVSSTSTMRSDLVSVAGTEEVELEKDNLLDQALDALYEKRGSTREKALSSIIEAFNSELQHEFVEKNCATLLHRCLNSIKKGSSKEIVLASHTVGLLTLTVGCGDSAREILEDSVAPISQALKSGLEHSKVASLVECLAIITFIGGNELEETERSMQIMWQVIRPKLGPNVAAARPSAAVIAAVVSAWSFLLTTIDGHALNPKEWQDSLSYLSGLLEKDDRSVRIAAGEALALIFEVGSLEKFSGGTKDSGDDSSQQGSKSLLHIQGLRAKILNQVRDLSVEAAGKGFNKKDLNSQRNLFRDIMEYMEDGYCPETKTKIGGDLLQTSTWSQMRQLNFLKHFLGGGFVKHMQENELLHDIFGFTPKKYAAGTELRLSSAEKRIYKSPNSVINKARTQFLNKQRILSEGFNTGHFAVSAADEEA